LAMRSNEQVKAMSSRWDHVLPKLAGKSPRMTPPVEEADSQDDSIECRDSREYPSVDLAHFAAIGGLTRRAYLLRMIAALRAGRLGAVLRPEAMEDLSKSISGKYPFVLCLQLSLNKPVEACIYCLCEKDGNSFVVNKIIPGIVGVKPKSIKSLNRMFEVAFCDMRTTI